MILLFYHEKGIGKLGKNISVGYFLQDREYGKDSEK